jgi:hypothetical protein
MPSSFENIIIDQSALQLMYNIIHWLLGFNLITFAFLEFRHQQKPADKRYKKIGPIVFLSNGLLFVSFVLIGHVIYIAATGLGWRFDHEHMIHLTIGVLMLLGGWGELHYRRNKKAKKWLISALPASLILSGALFLHPQHGLGNVLEYMTLYHRILAIGLIVAGLAMTARATFRNNRGVSVVALCLVAIAGLIFIAYRHKYNAVAECRTQGKIHEIKMTNSLDEPISVKAKLCDRVHFVSADNKRRYISFGGHSHHANYPGYVPQVLEKNDNSQEFVLTLGGEFSFHDHLNHKSSGYLVVERPKNLTNWRIYQQ